MACRSDSETQGCCGGCGQRPFPWSSALRDPAFLRLWLRRYRGALARGAGSGLATGLALLALGDWLGALGPMLGGPWLHPHPAALLPGALLAGLLLALGREGHRGRLAQVLRPALVLALAGAGNGLLATGGGPEAWAAAGSHAFAFLILGLPLLALATWALSSLAPSEG